jgi:hypothetical protein
VIPTKSANTAVASNQKDRSDFMRARFYLTVAAAHDNDAPELINGFKNSVRSLLRPSEVRIVGYNGRSKIRYGIFTDSFALVAMF